MQPLSLHGLNVPFPRAPFSLFTDGIKFQNFNRMFKSVSSNEKKKVENCQHAKIVFSTGSICGHISKGKDTEFDSDIHSQSVT